MNAELQGDGRARTADPARRNRAGVVFTDSDGDQPGVMMNLYRFVRGIGVQPVLVGNIKGLHDPYRTPTTQEAFARAHQLTPHMASSFADGTKMSFEMALIANATGLRAGTLGLYGWTPCSASTDAAADLFPLQTNCCRERPWSTTSSGPGPGRVCSWSACTTNKPSSAAIAPVVQAGRRSALFHFYTPYHLCHFEAPTTVARAVLFGDAAVTPPGRGSRRRRRRHGEERDLRAGETIKTAWVGT